MHAHFQQKEAVEKALSDAVSLTNEEQQKEAFGMIGYILRYSGKLKEVEQLFRQLL